MLSTLLVIGGVVVGLVLLLVLIVSLSARSSSRSPRGGATGAPGWVVDAGRTHPDAWAPLSTNTEIRAVR